ncbi:cell adhesion molecule Dscam2-like [Ornithodoros turicata]|uniref:cell adhesion molecule Dscam2-like n=1 Tax=Ornithodoros turicata TaxID=34597 RepID=UPI0031399268
MVFGTCCRQLWTLYTFVSTVHIGLTAEAHMEPPKITPFSFAKSIKPGGNARTTCLVEAGDNPMTFSWLRNGLDAATSRNVHIKSDTDYSILTIHPVGVFNVGNYTCIVKNKAGFDSYTAILDVEAPPTWKREPTNTRGILGTTVTIDCFATGSPSAKMRWLRLEEGSENTRELRISGRPRVVAHFNGTLVISVLNFQDIGRYVCEADNGIPPPLRKVVDLRVLELMARWF